MKPANMSIKDWLIKGMVGELNYPQDLIEKVIAFQGEDMLRAVKMYKEIEISGFGSIFIAKGKLNSHLNRSKTSIEKLRAKLETATEEEKPLLETKIEAQLENIKFYESKC